ncbi:MAG: hypothetical protein Q7S75_01480 [bacterium]|nr:hypothetical protein [bacterium]
MKKFFKYLAILLVIIVVVVMAGYILGKLGVADDKLLLTRFQADSQQFYAERGNFSDFCSSDLYSQLKSEYAYDISCSNGQSQDGSDLQITAELVSEFYGCKVATLPPVNGKPQKKIACIKLPSELGN